MEQVERRHIEQPTKVQDFIKSEPIELLEQQASCAWKQAILKTTGMILFLVVLIFLPEVLGLFGIECGTVNAIYNYLNDKNLPSGIIGTLLGLLLTFWILRPKVHIGQLQTYKFENNEYLALQFENIGIWDIYTVHVELQSYMFNAQERETERIDLAKAEIPIVKNIFSKKTDRSYTVVSANAIPNIKLIDKCEGIRCRITATNSFSGISFVYEKYYNK